MIGPIEDVEEPQPDELPGGLVPAWIEVKNTRIARKLEGATRPSLVIITTDAAARKVYTEAFAPRVPTRRP